jgi:hypothetical protein
MSLKQSSKESSGERENLFHVTSDCWHRERDRACLRVEVGADEVFIFSYQQLLGAHHLRTNDETLKITLSTHEVTLNGHRLEKLLSALQDFAVDWIRPLPPRYHDLGENGEPVITRIDVKVVE